MNVRIRQAIERRIVCKVVDDLLALGHEISVNYDESEDVVHRSTDRAAIVGALFACDIERIYVHRAGEEEPFGWVLAVYGNNGPDVVSDYTTNLDAALKAANELADALDRGELWPEIDSVKGGAA